MNEKTTLQRLRDVLSESSEEDHDWDQVDHQTTIESLGIDSLSILDLLYDIDQEFGIHLEAEDVVNISTVGEIAKLLE